ncbi:MAG: TIGR03915 family putative DNA repair protein [Oscillospiraceae bacterium]|jgi:probable DNA metabolism protein|nr:TIGR03915 family putative DNA repair protein [Oscillospiraceae bacterium]
MREPVPRDVVYQYDGSLEGFYCCLFESLRRGELPAALEDAADAQPRLFAPVWIETDPAHALRVQRSIGEKIAPRALHLTETVFLSCLEEKELHLLHFLLRGWREGAGFLRRGWSDPQLALLLKAERHLAHEAHLLTGFVRFSDYDGHLAATITPKNFVLPFLAPHFAARYRGEHFMIFDKTHRAALIHQPGGSRIVAAEHIEFPAVSAEEARYRALWKHFYDTVAIEGRENPRCRMTHMAKRYWENMTELQPEKAPLPMIESGAEPAIL